MYLTTIKNLKELNNFMLNFLEIHKYLIFANFWICETGVEDGEDKGSNNTN